jgi:aspartate 1-decarboxylase
MTETSYIQMCRAKIHRATVTEANLEYEGSITIDESLIEAAGFFEYEKVHVFNLNNGNRFETYVIRGERDSGTICLNGAAARLGSKGDRLIILSYSLIPQESAKSHKPRIVHVDNTNRVTNG